MMAREARQAELLSSKTAKRYKMMLEVNEFQ